ncbi:hypothetical protein G7Y89_g5878 [Cudoniella acicularis]|uniref:Uncharacterized protein n=1 Tax=Cudoniella acicularis TaxID=354080 RepID=A0A8H4RPV2_9HELO|nr:hypothetical protein G7Y89_g5878 [Cudoniella acicularis]
MNSPPSPWALSYDLLTLSTTRTRKTGKVDHSSQRHNSDMEMADSSQPRGSLDPWELKKENDKLREALDECKSQLIELLREDEQVSDATIHSEYERICKEIEGWVDDVLPEETKNFKDVFGKMMKEEREKGNLAGLKLYTPLPGQRFYEMDQWSWDRIDWLRNQSYANCAIISLVIWTFLESKIFDEDYPIGTLKRLPKNDTKHPESYQGHTSLLSGIIKVMINKKEQDQDAWQRVNKWRSETLTAMVATRHFKLRQVRYSQKLFDKLMARLKDWISPGTLSSHENVLREEIFDRAIKLHELIRCSKREYELDTSLTVLQQSTLMKNPKQWTLKDIKTWRPMNADANTIPYQLLFPGLYRMGDSEEPHELELVKPVVIVYGDEVQHSATQTFSPAHESRHTEVQPSSATKKLSSIPSASSVSSSQSENSKSRLGFLSGFKLKPLEQLRKASPAGARPIPSHDEATLPAAQGHKESGSGQYSPSKAMSDRPRYLGHREKRRGPVSDGDTTPKVSKTKFQAEESLSSFDEEDRSSESSISIDAEDSSNEGLKSPSGYKPTHSSWKIQKSSVPHDRGLR